MSSNTLTKQEYLRINRVSFQGLTPNQKAKKYQAYLAKHASKTQIANRAVPKKEPRKTNKNNSKNKRNVTQNNRAGLSECLINYARASIDPFETLENLPCVPDPMSLPSTKFMARCQGTMTVGVSGSGFIAMNPWAMAINDVQPQEATMNFPILASTSAFDLSTTDFREISRASGRTQGFNSNSQFDSSAFLEDAAIRSVIRLVAAGVEIDYIGQLLNQSGAVTVLQADGLNTFGDLLPFQEIRQNPRSVTCANAKDNRCYVSYYPTNSDVLSYKSLANYMPIESYPGSHNYPLLIFVTGATPGITFNFNAIAYFESQIPYGHVTPSESDPIGFPAFMSARTAVQPTADPRNDLRAVLTQTLKNIAHSISGYGGTIGQIIGSTVGMGPLGRFAGDATSELISNLFGS